MHIKMLEREIDYAVAVVEKRGEWKDIDEIEQLKDMLECRELLIRYKAFKLGEPVMVTNGATAVR